MRAVAISGVLVGFVWFSRCAFSTVAGNFMLDLAFQCRYKFLHVYVGFVSTRSVFLCIVLLPNPQTKHKRMVAICQPVQRMTHTTRRRQA